MSDPETHTFADAGAIPNSRLPLLVYRAALPADAAVMERHFAANGWSGGWHNGIFPFHHFHSNTHEVLGIASGRATVLFGGPEGQAVEVRAGDVVVLPAGTGHCRQAASADLLVVGAYPDGADFDTCRGEQARAEQVRRSIAAVPVPRSDPVAGAEGPLLRLWG